jgi:putative phage-type endonuclease
MSYTLIYNKTNSWFTSAAIGAKAAASIMRIRTAETPYDIWKKAVDMQLKHMNQEGSEWLRWREKGIGSSEVGSILGVCPYNKPKQVWDKKVSPEKVTQFDNVHTKRGKLNEPIVRDHYQELMGWPVNPVCIMHDQYEWGRASLDGRRDDGELIVEIKCPTSANWQKIKDSDIHDYWKAQIQYQLWLSEAKICHCLVFNVDSDLPFAKRLNIVEVYPDAMFIEAMVSRMEEFWKCVQDKTPPTW